VLKGPDPLARQKLEPRAARCSALGEHAEQTDKALFGRAPRAGAERGGRLVDQCIAALREVCRHPTFM